MTSPASLRLVDTFTDEVGRGRKSKQHIPAKMRWAAWERDNFTCRRCGTRQHLSVDHIIPESRGGSMTLDNLQTLCTHCNYHKADRLPTVGNGSQPVIDDDVLDTQLDDLEAFAGTARWSEGVAAKIGLYLSLEQGDMEDRHRQARAEMMRYERRQAIRLARWTKAMQQHYGSSWYEIAIQRNMTTLERQTLYNTCQILRIDPELRDAYDVWPSQLIAAATVPSLEGQANLLSHAELDGVGVRQVAKLAKVMRDTGSDDVPLLPATGDDSDMPDAPDPASDWWARYTNTVTALCDFMAENRIQEVDVLRWRRVFHSLGQERIK